MSNHVYKGVSSTAARPHRPRDVDVLVVGEALIDVVETSAGRTEHVGGSPANVALGLGRLGVPVALLTQLADDPRGRRTVEHLNASGVHVLAESMSASVTSTAVARIADDGQADYTFDLAWNDFARPDDIKPQVVHTGSLGAFLTPGAASVHTLLRETPAAEITFDPNIRPAFLGSRSIVFPVFEATARMSTVLKMSDEDAAWLYPGLPLENVLDEVLALGPTLAAITLGAEGALLAHTEHRLHIPAPNVTAVDTIGAGDTFMASLIHAVLTVGSSSLGEDKIQQIGRDAVTAAAVTVSRAGADLPWADEL